MGLLSEEQVQFFQEHGYLLVSGLVSNEIAAQGEKAMWRLMGADPLDSSTWSRPVIATGFSDPDLLACFTPQTRAAAAQLAEEPVENFPVPTGTLVINVFPQEGEWMPQGMHIDHAIKNHDHSVFPRPLRVASITYLNDVQPQSGGTCVWPGSHRIIEQLAKSDPVLYEKMWKLNENLSSLNLGEPLELLGKQGDVLFYHYLTAHSGSTNIGTYPRLALVYKW